MIPTKHLMLYLKKLGGKKNKEQTKCQVNWRKNIIIRAEIIKQRVETQQKRSIKLTVYFFENINKIYNHLASKKRKKTQ